MKAARYSACIQVSVCWAREGIVCKVNGNGPAVENNKCPILPNVTRVMFPDDPSHAVSPELTKRGRNARNGNVVSKPVTGEVTTRGYG